MSSTKEIDEPYTLYYNDYSLCSLMVRLTLAFCNDGNKEVEPLDVREQPVDIQHGGQLEEEYLCDVNPKGTVSDEWRIRKRSLPHLDQVPVLTHPSKFSPPITESLDISRYFSTFYPTLIPSHLSSEIDSLLRSLHSINYFSLTYTHKPQRASDMEGGVLKLLERDDISERYQKALEFKLRV